MFQNDLKDRMPEKKNISTVRIFAFYKFFLLRQMLIKTDFSGPFYS